MAFNPFLSMGEPAAANAGGAEVLNPFMIAEAEPVAFSGDNPFAVSNPFSDFGGGFEPAAGDTVPVDIFGGPDPPGDGARLFESPQTTDLFANPTPNSDRLVKPTDLELTSTTADVVFPQSESAPPSRPLPPETQNLILSVTGQMEFASSHLLDRIPPTRTPSPVSVRDIQSPCPTPEPEAFEDVAPEPTAVSGAGLDVNRNKAAPARPPPARPPPAARPPPPRPAPPPVPAAPLPSVSPPQDDINLFDAPARPAVKPTKEAILSLYSAPKKEEERQIDFLSDDILEELPTAPEAEPTKVEPVFPKRDAAELKAGAIAPMDCSEPSSEMDVTTTEQFPPVEKRTPEAINPFESVAPEETISASVINAFGSTAEDTFMAEASFKTEAQPKPMLENEITDDAFASSMDAFESTTANESVDPANAVTSSAQEWGVGTGEARAALEAAGWGAAEAMAQDPFPDSQDAFDAFSAKFESTSAQQTNASAWGDCGAAEAEAEGESGFEEGEGLDPFLCMAAPAPAPPPAPAATPRLRSQGSLDSTDDTFSVFIRPKEGEAESSGGAVPALAPPPRGVSAAAPESPRANPFDRANEDVFPPPLPHPQHSEVGRRRSGGSAGSGGETPPTPLFDEDVSQPLEEFPRTRYSGPGWEMHLRQPNKKKITGQRFWKKVFVRVTYVGDNPVVQLLNSAGDKEPFQELPLQACYSVSEIGAQQFDQFGKIFTVKLQYVFYKERPGVRPGQVTKAERITNKLSQFAAYAIQGDYQGVKEFGSDLRKLGLPVEHAPQVSQLFKLGSLSYEDVKQFSCCVEEALFRLAAHRDRALAYKMEEVQITAVDELYVEQDADGAVTRQIARVRLFFLGFLTGMPDVELGVNDLRRQGREVVGRHDIIPVVTEEWIRVEDAEFHACVQPEDFTNTQIIKFKPPDACYIELMRFRVRPPKNRELPLQLKAVWCVTGNKVELRADVLVPGFASRKLGQVPCEDVAIRFPIPECWIYLFRVEKHFRYGSVKSAHRRTGKIKGIERFLGAVETLQESLIEVTSGQAKYEHQHRAIVWRMPRLPKEGQGAYTTHNLVCRMALTSYDQVPEELAKCAYVEFTMPATQVSHMTVRSVSLQNHDGEPPEKYVRYLARHEYIVGIERTTGQCAPAYALAAVPAAPPAAVPAAPPAAPPPPVAPPQPPSSDSDSD